MLVKALRLVSQKSRRSSESSYSFVLQHTNILLQGEYNHLISYLQSNIFKHLFRRKLWFYEFPAFNYNSFYVALCPLSIFSSSTVEVLPQLLRSYLIDVKTRRFLNLTHSIGPLSEAKANFRLKHVLATSIINRNEIKLALMSSARQPIKTSLTGNHGSACLYNCRSNDGACQGMLTHENKRFSSWVWVCNINFTFTHIYNQFYFFIIWKMLSSFSIF